MLLIVVPVTGAAALQMIPAGRVRLGRLAAKVAVLLIAGTAVLGVMGSAGLSTSDRTSVTLRADIWSHTIEAIGDFGAIGSGMGTFPSVYPLYEDPTTIERTYINHAHNDYLESALEVGLPGVVLLLLFLGWWSAQAFVIWRSPNAADMARAACIASAAVLLHTLVDYPLRTAAIATVLAVALGLMAKTDLRRHQARTADRRPARHLTL